MIYLFISLKRLAESFILFSFPGIKPNILDCDIIVNDFSISNLAIEKCFTIV